jgi:hypothetical protein
MKLSVSKMSWWAQTLSAPVWVPYFIIMVVCTIVMMIPVGLIALLDGGKGFEKDSD